MNEVEVSPTSREVRFRHVDSSEWTPVSDCIDNTHPFSYWLAEIIVGGVWIIGSIDTDGTLSKSLKDATHHKTKEDAELAYCKYLLRPDQEPCQ